jgi:formimidoylglutamate deiminase
MEMQAGDRAARRESFWMREVLLPDGWARGVRIEAEDGAIAAIHRDVEPETSDLRLGAVVPGVPNLHSHAFQRALAGLTSRRGASADSFWSWREAMYACLDRMTPEDVEAITAFVYAEMLEGGFTHVGEFHYLHHAQDGARYADPAELSHRVVAAARRTGIGMTLLPVFYAHGGFGSAPPTPGQRRFTSTVEEYAALLAAVRPTLRGFDRLGCAPHSLRAVDPDELRDLVQLSNGTPMHIHIAEQTREVEECVAWSGQRPVEWLLDHAPVDARWCLVHATHVTGRELDGIIRSGAVVGLCPTTEADLGDGVFPAAALYEGGGRFGVGSDSNTIVDAGHELRALEYSQRLNLRKRNVLATSPGESVARALFHRAGADGARALGILRAGLVVGGAADFVALDERHPLLAGRAGDDLLDSWVFGMHGTPIDSVWRLGRRVVEGGRHVLRDELQRGFIEAMRRLQPGRVSFA